MNRNQFRLLLITELSLQILASVYEIFFASSLVEKIADFAHQEEPALEGVKLILAVGFGAPAFVIALISWVGLFLFKNWARHLWLASFVLIFLAYPFLGITVSGGISQIFYDASMLCAGAIIALVYCSPLREYFDQGLTSGG